MRNSFALLVVLAGLPARADAPIGRIGAMAGWQRTDRNAWVFGPAVEVTIPRIAHSEFAIRGEAQLELGDFSDPFGKSNIISGNGPHVNHVLFGPAWRPARYAKYAFGAGAGLGVLVMHSRFAPQAFTKGVAGGLFVEGGRALGPVTVALQLRLDVSAPVAMAGPEGQEVPTTTGRVNFVFAVPIDIH